MEKYTVVIPAAGQGKRMKAGKNKQFLLIDQIPLLIHTLRVFEEDILCHSIILVVNKQELKEVEKLIETYKINKVDKLVIGGKERQESVYEGLKVIEGNPIVLIHDGARPFVQHSVIHNLIHKVVEKGAAIVATPVKDTIKQAVDGIVEKTVHRNNLWSIQTPQGFRYNKIVKGHQEAEKQDFFGTDDASLMEFIGEKVYIVEGDYENIKITTPEDILYGEAIIEKRKGE
ncbi:2-C-methyl-D-erythritol 4-phosphate cytidylyltransferase [Evansella sp. AB-P1]|uniref:2-C-methyl-D-erythritol 4-phosphate cytidylyltransferase n=1 Tax=Evansella sp. AB-P1 TaxID=3037653 RepID=UPI00241D3E42|nr:2-C-methyl-D-erythritol 4-phosphate cytidylyltransferase [Evansella sp. AB-P1]MDG5788142.1 2-C-methyl-D-erythritol 4-phosphate cytidylyltransferase [Evansella sp. AB-P1]